MAGFNALAVLMENQDMQTIIDVFAENVLMHLIQSNGKIVDSSLDVFQIYTSNIHSCRMLARTSIMNRLIQDGSEKY